MAKVGRPTKMTEAVVQKLEYAFMRGLTDEEACVYADICRSTLHNYCTEHPEFMDRKEVLKNHPTAKAKLNVTEAIENGDEDMSKWWLERKAKDEFSTRHDIGGEIKVKRLEDVL